MLRYHRFYTIRANVNTVKKKKKTKKTHVFSTILKIILTSQIHWKHLRDPRSLQTTLWELLIKREKYQQPQYADDTTLVTESEEKQKSLLMRMKEGSEKAGLKLSIQKLKIMASCLITSWQTEDEKLDAVADFIFLGSKITADGEIKRWWI